MTKIVRMITHFSPLGHTNLTYSSSDLVLLILSISKFNIKKKIKFNTPVSENIQYNFFFNFLYQFNFCTNRTLDPDTHGRILKNCDAWESATVYNVICTYNAYNLYI